MDRVDALRLFTRLVEHGSFSAAAKDLKVKQSTASKWIAELEADLGATLVQRTTRSVQVTEAGQRLLERAQRVLAAYDELRDVFEADRPEPSGRVRLSVPVVFGRLFVVPAIVAFAKRHPQVGVEIIFNDRYVNLVDEGFDLAIRVGVPTDTSARGRKLADGGRVLVASPRYLRMHGRPSAPKDLKHHECLIHGDANAATVWRFGSEPPVRVRGKTSANSSEAVLQFACSGLGIALLADWLVGPDLRRGRLVPLLDEYSLPPAPIHALSPPGRFTTTTIRALVDHLAEDLQPRLSAATAGLSAPISHR